MELKDFKSGVETLSRYTYQRSKDPDPFMVQVGKDSKLSLVSGNAFGTAVWRTGYESHNHGKFGIDSKLLVQAAKNLKGRGVTVDFEVTNTGLVVKSSSGGSVDLKFGKLPPIIHRPPQSEPTSTLQIGNLDQFARKVAVTENNHYDWMMFEHRGDGKVRAISTDGYAVYEADLRSSGNVPELTVIPIAFWNGLRGFTSNGEARFFETGLQVRKDQFEFSTSFVDGRIAYKSWWDNLFPRGETFDVGLELDRKELLAKIKEAGTPLLTLNVGDDFKIMSNPVDGSVGSAYVVPTSKKKGKGTNYVVSSLLGKILNALDGDKVILCWNKTDKPFYMIRTPDVYYECFILAPVVPPND